MDPDFVSIAMCALFQGETQLASLFGDLQAVSPTKLRNHCSRG